MNYKHISLAFALISTLIYCTIPATTIATSLHAPWWTHLTYHFQHANPLHLLTNLYALFFMLRSISRICHPLKAFLLALLIATLASIPITTPTVGASGVIYALIGYYTYGHIAGRLRFTSKKATIIYPTLFALTFIAGYLIPSIAGTVHLLSYVGGIFLAPLIIQAQPNRTPQALLQHLKKQLQQQTHRQQHTRQHPQQVGGNHYTKHPIQPIDFIEQNHLSFSTGNVIKYITRWKDKGGTQDLKKALQYLDFIEQYNAYTYPRKALAITVKEYADKNNLTSTERAIIYHTIQAHPIHNPHSLNQARLLIHRLINEQK